MILTTGTMGLIFIGVGILLGTAAPVAILLMRPRAPAGHRDDADAFRPAHPARRRALRYVLLMGPQHLQTLYLTGHEETETWKCQKSRVAPS